jgi:hypothetical protein
VLICFCKSILRLSYFQLINISTKVAIFFLYPRIYINFEILDQKKKKTLYISLIFFNGSGKSYNTQPLHRIHTSLNNYLINKRTCKELKYPNSKKESQCEQESSKNLQRYSCLYKDIELRIGP